MLVVTVVAVVSVVGVGGVGVWRNWWTQINMRPFMVVDTASWLNSQSAVSAVSRHRVT